MGFGKRRQRGIMFRLFSALTRVLTIAQTVMCPAVPARNVDPVLERALNHRDLRQVS